MKVTEIAQKSEKELTDFISEREQALAKTMIEMNTKKVANVKQIKGIKRSLAQALTIHRQRQISSEEAAGE